MSRIIAVLCAALVACGFAGLADGESSPFGFVPAIGSFLPCYVGEGLHPEPPPGAQIYLGPGRPAQPLREIQIPQADLYWEDHGFSLPEACVHFDQMDAMAISDFVQTHYKIELTVNGRAIPASYVSIARVVAPGEDNEVYWLIRLAFPFPVGFIAPGVYISTVAHYWDLLILECTPSPWVPELIEYLPETINTTTVTILYEPENP